MPKTYSIAAAAKLTGLSADTLRVWERRYGVVSPTRDGAGIRQYAEADVARLTLMRAATQLGHPIRRIATLNDEELRALVSGLADQAASGDGAVDTTVTAILDAIQKYDVAQAEMLLNAGALLLPADRFLIQVLTPLMHRVGELWESGRFSVAQEHIASNLVRNLIGTLTRLHSMQAAESMLFATPPGELHEFGIALAAALASLRGIRICVLGPNVPAEEVVRAARYVRPQAVVIGCVVPCQAEIHEYLQFLDSKLPARTELWTGGNGIAAGAARKLPGRTQYIQDLAQFADIIAQRTA